MRISGCWKSDIASRMQITLNEHDTAVQSAPTHQDRFANWGLQPVSMPEWLDLWSAIHRFVVLHPRQADQGNLFRAIVRDDVVGARYATGCEMFRHDKGVLARSGDLISIQRLHAGSAAIEFQEHNYVHRPDTISITDLNQTYRGSHHQAVIEQVMIPRASLGLSEAEPFAPMLISTDSERGRALAGLLNAFFAPEQTASAFERNRFETVLLSAIRESWTQTSDREAWWNGRRNLIRKYIDTHLDDPNLGPLQICDLFNMSRATLYRMFEPDGGVRRRIQDRRLHSAMWDLATSGIKRGRLSQVSERWGFSSDANFNRAVKIAYGLPPGALFKTSVEVAPPQATADPAGGAEFRDPFYEWFHQARHGAPDSHVAGA